MKKLAICCIKFVKHSSKVITIFLLLISVYLVLLLRQNIYSVTYFQSDRSNVNNKPNTNPYSTLSNKFPYKTSDKFPLKDTKEADKTDLEDRQPDNLYSRLVDAKSETDDQDDPQFKRATPSIEQTNKYFGKQLEEDKEKFLQGISQRRLVQDSTLLPIKKFVPFGDPTNFDCDNQFCHINNRTIKRELIHETPEDMFTFLPPEQEFLKEFRNPCWKSKDRLGESKLFCLPYFYIIGFTKCGTTDLFGILRNHSLVSSRAGKETHFFDRTRRGRVIRMNRRPERLPVSLMAFANSGRHRLNLFSTYEKEENSDVLFHGITMDATPSHVWDNEFWELFHPGYREPPVTNADLIHTITPKAKIIVSLRDPIKRMQSAYQFFCAYHVYKCDYPVTNRKFHILVKHAIDIFNRCTEKNSIRGCVYNTNTHQLATHLYASIYSVYLKDWLQLFPRNQIYIMKFEEHIADELTNINQICNFLEIPRFPQEEMKKYLSEHMVKNSLSEENKIPYILPETMKMLTDFFRPFNRELVEILGDEKWTWGYE